MLLQYNCSECCHERQCLNHCNVVRKYRSRGFPSLRSQDGNNSDLSLCCQYTSVCRLKWLLESLRRGLWFEIIFWGNVGSQQLGERYALQCSKTSVPVKSELVRESEAMDLASSYRVYPKSPISRGLLSYGSASHKGKPRPSVMRLTSYIS